MIEKPLYVVAQIYIYIKRTGKDFLFAKIQSMITLVDGFSLHFEEHRAWQTTIVRDGNFDRKVDGSLMCWNVMIVHVTDLLSDTSKSAADDFRLLAFFGLMSLIPKLWSSLSSRLTCETVMFLRFSQKYSNSNHNCML